jgi:hypothetical protein
MTCQVEGLVTEEQVAPELLGRFQIVLCTGM